jgi:hypothetical protein
MNEARNTYFTTDGFTQSIKFKGITYGHTWNGWAVPYFTKEVAFEIVALMPEQHLKYSEETDCFIYNDFSVTGGDEEYNEYFNADEIDGQKYYSIGGCSWCWDEFYEEEV